MKKIVLGALVWIGLMPQAKAQGSLQFNQVVLLEGNANSCATCWTVPSGKVWKITSMSTSTSSLASLHVNNRQLGFLSQLTSNSDSRWVYQFPIWLPAGAQLGYSSIGNGHNITFFAIEFNVLP